MQKKYMAAIAVPLVAVAILLLAAFQHNKIPNFSYEEYLSYTLDFSSDRVLGKTESVKDAKEKAERLWTELYGGELKEKAPYKVFVDVRQDVWLVTGRDGKAAHILIRMSDGKVLAVWRD